MAQTREKLNGQKSKYLFRIPWQFFLRRLARAEGFLDPILVLSNLKRFAQPSELTVPKELLRAGAVMQARGLINSQAIQHNMDWVWPCWVERQFNPKSDSFIPRAFNLTHINLTHRNWTALGVPDFKEFVIVDPCGLITPFYDGWSLDHWIVEEDGNCLVPSKLTSVQQDWILEGNTRIVTTVSKEDMVLTEAVEVYQESQMMICRIQLTASGLREGWLVSSLRPYNPEGISFIDKIELLEDRHGFKVNSDYIIHFDSEPDKVIFSHYWKGDVFNRLHLSEAASADVECGVGMATAAALYKINAKKNREITLTIPLCKNPKTKPSHEMSQESIKKWNDNLSGNSQLAVPDKRFQFLYEAAIRSMILHSPEDIYPGPFTYKHFWFRDAVLILHAMLCAGMIDRAEKVIDRFSLRQNHAGYFLSQEGEWDSNGEALWIIRRWCELTGKEPKPEWRSMIYRAAQWIQKKRVTKKDSPYFGLLPVGFSAEHFGPNDYYYWDDFWGIAGLRAASFLAGRYQDDRMANEFLNEAHHFSACVERSLERDQKRLGTITMSASPHRRLDAGAIGSLVAGYPLQLFKPEDPRLIHTAEYLYKECFEGGGFYQQINHSGINIYLTLHVAQIFLRAGNPLSSDLMKEVASLASPTGQWPEAIHPKTKGGCMGDGQHIWAAAEWVMMMRNCFVREEEQEEQTKLIFLSGIPVSWLASSEWIAFGPTLTRFGWVSVQMKSEEDKVRVQWTGEWRGKKPTIEIRIPNLEIILPKDNEHMVEIKRRLS